MEKEIKKSNLVTKDNGPRPAGKPDQCFYCGEKIGKLHKKDCVCRVKEVDVRSWDKQAIEFQRNDGSWCADNGLEDIVEYANKKGCSCGFFKAELL
jgi:hypothetical protein